MTTVHYYLDAKPPRQTLLRRADYVDEAFVAGKWQPTKAIVDFMFGHNDWVDEISEDRARRVAPTAF